MTKTNLFFTQLTTATIMTAALLGGSVSTLADYQPLDKVIAIVEDSIITQSDMDARMAQVEQNFANNSAPRPPEEEIRKQVLDLLILEKLQLQMGERAGVNISDERLTEAMNRIAERNGMTLEQFRQRLETEGVGYQNMREKIRSDMIIQQVQQGNLRSRIQISDQEIDNYLKSADGQAITSSQYGVAHIVLPLDNNASDAKVQAAETAMRDIRQQIINKQLSFNTLLKGKTVGAYALSGTDLGVRDPSDLPSLFADVVLNMNEGDLSQPVRSGAGWHLIKLYKKTGGKEIVHQTNVRHILVSPSEVRTDEQALQLTNELYQRLQNGEDFALIAKEYSDDPGSALQGGDLGWSNPGQFVPEFEATMKALKDGETSKPVKSQFGYHIIQKIAERDHDLTNEKHRQQAQQAIYEKKFSEEREIWLMKIHDEAFIELK